MVRWVVAVAAFLSVLGAPKFANAQDCPQVAETIGEMERAGFDGAYREGWVFGAERYRDGCEAAMADALASFRERHATELSAPALSAYRYRLFWFEGQYAARTGQFERAALLFGQARSEPRREYDPSFYDAYIAFFNRDRDGAQRARDTLANDLEARQLNEMQRLSADWQVAKLDGLLACFDRPFAEADGECSRQFMH